MTVECSICTDELLQAGSRVSNTPCGHVYHSQCLLNWIENNGNRGNCPVCRANFEPFNVIPLLTLDQMDGSTSSATNQQFEELERKHEKTQSLLKFVMDSLTTANEELKARDAIIERLKVQSERKPQGVIIQN